MQLQSLTCNNCGAPVQVAPDANYVTCAHCGSQLAIHRTGDSAFTQVLDKLDERTEQILHNTDQILEQNRQLQYHLTRSELLDQLKAIDQNWVEVQAQYARKYYYGQKHIPTLDRAQMSVAIWAGGVVLGAVLSATGFLILELAPDSFGSLPCLLGAVIAVACAYPLFHGVGELNYARAFAAAYNGYLRERQAVTAQIDELDLSFRQHGA